MKVVRTVNDIAKQNVNLPDTLEDLTQFVLVGKAKLNAYMVKLQAVNRLSVAQEIRDQTLKETQEISTALIAAEQRIGELLLSIPKASGQYSNSENRPVSKNTVVKEMGYSKDEAANYQQMAKNPEVVQKVIDNALANGEVVTKTQVIKEIKALKEELRKAKEQKPVVKEVVKTVVPDDYEDIKRKASMSEVYRKDFQRMKKAYDEMAEKWKSSESEKENIKKKIKEKEDAPIEEIRKSSLVFCAGIAKFIENYGGYVWLTSKLNDLPKRERDGFIQGINALDSWVKTMKTNMEGKYE